MIINRKVNSVFKRYHSHEHFSELYSELYLQDGGENQLAQICN